jgi:hypothetical protein
MEKIASLGYITLGNHVLLPFGGDEPFEIGVLFATPRGVCIVRRLLTGQGASEAIEAGGPDRRAPRRPPKPDRRPGPPRRPARLGLNASTGSAPRRSRG